MNPQQRRADRRHSRQTKPRGRQTLTRRRMVREEEDRQNVLALRAARKMLAPLLRAAEETMGRDRQGLRGDRYGLYGGRPDKIEVISFAELF